MVWTHERERREAASVIPMDTYDCSDMDMSVIPRRL